MRELDNERMCSIAVGLKRSITTSTKNPVEQNTILGLLEKLLDHDLNMAIAGANRIKENQKPSNEKNSEGRGV